MPEKYNHDIHPRRLQCRERLLSLDYTNTCYLAAPDALEKEIRRICNIYDRSAVSSPWSNAKLCIDNENHSSACIASTLGLYYRIVLAREGDFTWREVQVGSLV